MGWREELNRYFQNGIKETHENTLGVEIEHFMLYLSDFHGHVHGKV